VPEEIFAGPERRVTIQSSSTYTPAFLELLQRTVWGSGGVTYAIPGIAGILDRIIAPRFLSLRENQELVAVSTLIKKSIRVGETSYPAYYSYALAVEASRQGRGYGTLLAEQALAYGRRILGEQGIFYGYVEAENTYSLKALEKVGRKSLGRFHLLSFNRLRPRDADRVKKLAPTGEIPLLHLLNQAYAPYALVDLDQSLNPENYHVIQQGEEIVAGVQVSPNHFSLRHLPGLSGLLLRALPSIPPVRRLLPQSQYRFLRFGNLYAQKGREAELFTLMEALLARHRLNFGVICLDKRSPVYRQLAPANKFGVLHTLIDVPVHVMAYCQGFTESEGEAIRRQPLFISIMDPL
jgi:GNAT superfamily N-acetyltransferase